MTRDYLPGTEIEVVNEVARGQVKYVLFDFDGTLTRPGAIDFAVIKRAVGCPLESPLLEYIAALPDPDDQRKAYTALNAFEAAAARRSMPNDGAESLLSHLRGLGVPTGLISRNSLDSIKTALDNKIGD